ncbi:MAG: hypothetical protein HPY71_14310 [Firmicutes bacterium]|nr:hypothetical protein [Bacillota bacterium]
MIENVVGQEISINLGGAVGYSAAGVTFIHATVANETEKAIQLKAGNHTIWLPKTALVPKAHYFKLAKWFKPDGYQNWFFEKYQTVNVISACN